MVTTTHLIWLVAAVCFIFSLGGLSRHETARRGNWLGIIGMLLAIVATFIGGVSGGLTFLILAIIVGGGVGVLSGDAGSR